MKQKLEDDVRRVISKVVTPFYCPECGHVTLAHQATEVFYEVLLCCYTCGHTFRKGGAQWVDVGKER